MRKVPLRKCVATNEQLPKKDLIRVVKNNEGEIFIDPTGKKNGRGAYLKKSEEAVLQAKKNGALKRALEIDIPDSIYEELLEYVK